MNEWALLYLDNLQLAPFHTRQQVEGAIAEAKQKVRAYVILRWVERAGRKLWAPQETNFLSRL